MSVQRLWVTPGPAMCTGQSGPPAVGEECIPALLGFLDEIGIRWSEAELGDATFLPGLAVRGGQLLVDRSRLAYPGDILHEAAHLALTPAAQRPQVGSDDLGEPGLEIAALAWSYAAALHLGIAPEVVFHDGGYKGQGRQIADGLRTGATLGQPVLAWLGLTEFGRTADPERSFPRMCKWLRD